MAELGRFLADAAQVGGTTALVEAALGALDLPLPPLLSPRAGPALEVAGLLDTGPHFFSVALGARSCLSLYDAHEAWDVGIEGIEEDQWQDVVSRVGLLARLVAALGGDLDAVRSEPAGHALLELVAGLDLVLAFGTEFDPVEPGRLAAEVDRSGDRLEAVLGDDPAAAALVGPLVDDLSARADRAGGRVVALAGAVRAALPEVEGDRDALRAEAASIRPFGLLAAGLVAALGGAAAAEEAGETAAAADARQRLAALRGHRAGLVARRVELAEALAAVAARWAAPLPRVAPVSAGPPPSAPEPAAVQAAAEALAAAEAARVALAPPAAPSDTALPLKSWRAAVGRLEVVFDRRAGLGARRTHLADALVDLADRPTASPQPALPAAAPAPPPASDPAAVQAAAEALAAAEAARVALAAPAAPSDTALPLAPWRAAVARLEDLVDERGALEARRTRLADALVALADRPTASPQPALPAAAPAPPPASDPAAVHAAAEALEAAHAARAAHAPPASLPSAALPLPPWRAAVARLEVVVDRRAGLEARRTRLVDDLAELADRPPASPQPALPAAGPSPPPAPEPEAVQAAAEALEAAHAARAAHAPPASPPSAALPLPPWRAAVARLEDLVDERGALEARRTHLANDLAELADRPAGSPRPAVLTAAPSPPPVPDPATVQAAADSLAATQAARAAHTPPASPPIAALPLAPWRAAVARLEVVVDRRAKLEARRTRLANDLAELADRPAASPQPAVQATAPSPLPAPDPAAVQAAADSLAAAQAARAAHVPPAAPPSAALHLPPWRAAVARLEAVAHTRTTLGARRTRLTAALAQRPPRPAAPTPPVRAAAPPPPARPDPAAVHTARAALDRLATAQAAAARRAEELRRAQERIESQLGSDDRAVARARRELRRLSVAPPQPERAAPGGPRRPPAVADLLARLSRVKAASGPPVPPPRAAPSGPPTTPPPDPEATVLLSREELRRRALIELDEEAEDDESTDPGSDATVLLDRATLARRRAELDDPAPAPAPGARRAIPWSPPPRSEE